MEKPLNIAVIGSGISGLSCGWLLSQQHKVTLFEKDERFGGHSNTVTVADVLGPVPVDTGFLVFNPATYPNLVAFFKHFEVPVKPADMSFAFSVDQGVLEYSGKGLAGLFAQKSNLLRPRFWRMVWDILRFYREAEKWRATLSPEVTLGELLKQGKYSDAFRDYHLLPMGAAIWSTPMATMLEYPALTFLNFCANHGLLQVKNRPQWYTVDGGSRIYVKKVINEINKNGEALLNCGVRNIRRRVGGKVAILDWQGKERVFDHVVLACHPDQALKLLADPREQEQQLLSAIRYERNKAILHSDERLMPLRKKVWSSWNYLARQKLQQGKGNGESDREKLSVSYWLNRLQSLKTRQPIILSLNPSIEPDVNKVHASFLYDHPVFDAQALAAQENIGALQGQDNTWFCGAWLGYGFHEDGLQSGLATAEALASVERPWLLENPNSRIASAATAVEKKIANKQVAA